MHGSRTGGAFAVRRLRRIAFLLIVPAQVLASAGTASADTAFTADVKGQVRRNTGCPEGAFACGKASIPGYGSAEYRYFVTSFQPVSDDCGDFTATSTFTLADDSRLTLDETGTACGPGGSFFANGPKSYGNPAEANATWVVQEGTGVFTGIDGSGTSKASFAGAHYSAHYTGMLQG